MASYVSSLLNIRLHFGIETGKISHEKTNLHDVGDTRARLLVSVSFHVTAILREARRGNSGYWLKSLIIKTACSTNARLNFWSFFTAQGFVDDLLPFDAALVLFANRIHLWNLKLRMEVNYGVYVLIACSLAPVDVVIKPSSSDWVSQKMFTAISEAFVHQ